MSHICGCDSCPCYIYGIVFSKNNNRNKDHLHSCIVLWRTQYKIRHDRGGRYLNWNICNLCWEGNLRKLTWTSHKTGHRDRNCKQFMGHYKTYRYKAIKLIDQTSWSKRHKNKMCLFINLAIPTDSNVSRRYWRSNKIQGFWNGNLQNVAREDINNSCYSWSHRMYWKWFWYTYWRDIL